MPVKDVTSRTKASAIVNRAKLDRQRGAFERFSALGVLFFSFAGSIAALSGGWSQLAGHPRLAPIASGVAIQAALTAAEWWYGDGRGRWRYRLALLIDASLTTVGYGPLIVPWLTPYLAARGAGDLALYAAWGLAAIASGLIAWYPEQVLIDD